MPFSARSRRAAPAPSGGRGGRAARTGSRRLNNSPKPGAHHRLGSPAGMRRPTLRQSRVALRGPSWLTGSASHALGFHSLHHSVKSGFFFFFFHLQQPDLCPAPPVYCQVLARRGEGVRRPERGVGAPKGVTEGPFFGGVRVTASAKQCPKWPLPSSAAISSPPLKIKQKQPSTEPLNLHDPLHSSCLLWTVCFLQNLVESGFRIAIRPL